MHRAGYALLLSTLLACADASESREVSTPDGLILRYAFDEGQGDLVYDRSGLEPALDLHIENPASVQWSAEGLQMLPGGAMHSRVRTDRVVDAVQSSDAVTFELWIEEAAQDANGTLFELELEDWGTNFAVTTLRHPDGTLGYNLRMRMDGALTGRTASAVVPDLSAQHIVFARDDDGLVTLYLDGAPASTSELTGSFDTWSVLFDLRVGRGFLGSYQGLSMYNRALNAEDVMQRYNAGP